jgi:hypothetical protein
MDRPKKLSLGICLATRIGMELENNVPRRPREERRPADTVGSAIMMKIAAGEIEEKLTEKSSRVHSEHPGAEARAQRLSAEERSKIAKKAAGALWERD